MDVENLIVEAILKEEKDDLGGPSLFLEIPEIPKTPGVVGFNNFLEKSRCWENFHQLETPKTSNPVA